MPRPRFWLASATAVWTRVPLEGQLLLIQFSLPDQQSFVPERAIPEVTSATKHLIVVGIVASVHLFSGHDSIAKFIVAWRIPSEPA
jgi:hypothetical protein